MRKMITRFKSFVVVNLDLAFERFSKHTLWPAFPFWQQIFKTICATSRYCDISPDYEIIAPVTSLKNTMSQSPQVPAKTGFISNENNYEHDDDYDPSNLIVNYLPDEMTEMLMFDLVAILRP